MQKYIFPLLCSVFFAITLKAQTTYQVSTLAGSGISSSKDGIATEASFYDIEGICMDGSGNIFVSEKRGNKIRKITPSGVVTTVAGSGKFGSADGAGASASFINPAGICIDTAGNIFVADIVNNKIRKITKDGVVSTFAGAGRQGYKNGKGAMAQFNAPYGICIDGAGNLYVTDDGNCRIRKITPDGSVTTFAGSGVDTSQNGTGSSASFNNPAGICVDGSGNLFVAEVGSNNIRKITPAGVVTTIAGNGKPGAKDGNGDIASFSKPNGICVDALGNLYITDLNNFKIRKITPGGKVSTIAGSGVNNSKDGIGTSASFNYPIVICNDNSGYIYVGEYNYIRKLNEYTPAPPVVNYLDMPGNLCLGSTVNYQPTTTGSETGLVLKVDSFPVSAPKAICKNSSSVFVLNANDSILQYDFSGKLLKVYNTLPVFANIRSISADDKNRVYVVAPDLTFPALTSIYRLDTAGNWDFTFGNGSTPSGVFSSISGIAFSPDGKLYVADTTNGAIATVDTSSAMPTNLPFPNTKHGYDKPTGMAFGKEGQLYIADVGQKTILARNASDNNYYPVINGLDTLKWKINSVDIDTNALNPAFFMSSNTSQSPVVSFTSEHIFGLEQVQLLKFDSLFNFKVLNPAGLVNINGSGLAPVTWVANTVNNNVKRIKVYGYTITPALPKGLYFNFDNGTIAGTPLVSAPSTTYTITTQSSLGTTTKKITFSVTPSTVLSNTPGTGKSIGDQPDGMKVTYMDKANCSKMVDIEDSVGGTTLGKVSVEQTVYPTIATFNSKTFIGRKTEINTQDPNAQARLRLYFTYNDIENYNKFNGTGTDLSNDTTKGTMQIGVLQLHTDSTGHIEQIKHNPITANWISKDQNWEVNFKVDKFSVFYAAESGSLDSFNCANAGHDSVVTNKAYYWHGEYLKTSGTYVDTFVNASGCDSVVTLKLTTNCANTGKDSIVTSAAYYIWANDTLKASGTYVDTFSNANGCDSVVTLKLTVKSSGIAENVSAAIYVYPNPSSGLFTINLGQNLGTINYTITAIDGRVIAQKQNISGTITSIDMSKADNGIYFLRVQGHGFIRIFKLVKE